MQWCEWDRVQQKATGIKSGTKRDKRRPDGGDLMQSGGEKAEEKILRFEDAFYGGDVEKKVKIKSGVHPLAALRIIWNCKRNRDIKDPIICYDIL